MLKVYETLERVRSTSSKNLKLEYLMEQKDNEALQQFLRMTYEPKINFYQKAVDPKLVSPMLACQAPARELTTDDLDDIYDQIAKRYITGNEARVWVATLWHSLVPQGQELLEYLIQRDVKAGISAGTINKVWPGLVTDVPYMRCCLPKDTNLSAWPWASGIYSQIKADGMFANVSHHERTHAVTIESRAGSPFPLDYFKDLVAEIKSVVPAGMQLHGELLMIDPNGQIMPREEGNGLFNKLLKEGELPSGYRPIYQAWDVIPLTEAKVKNKYKIPYKTRFGQLVSYFSRTITSFLNPIEFKMVYSLTEAYAHAKEAMKRKLEGTVIKHPEAPWEDTTSKYQAKLKLEFVVELRVRSMKAAAAKSKNAELFGSLVCESECGLLEVGVTGLTDEKRKYIFDHFDAEYKDSIISVRANGIMEPSNETGGKWSLFLPRFVEERFDKTQADSLKRIREIQEAAIDTLAHTQ